MLLYAAQVARKLRISKPYLYRLHGKGLTAKRNDHGWFVYDSEEVEKFAKNFAVKRRRRTRKAPMTEYELARECFRYFDSGASLRDIVVEVGVTPEKVRKWYAEWKADLDHDPARTPEERLRLQQEQIKLETERLKRDGVHEENLQRALSRSGRRGE